MDSNSFSNSCIDFYVPIIDNYGDMGFAVNLAISLHEKYQGLQIRFFSDDQGLFQMFFPESIPDWMEYRELKSLYIDDTIAPAKLIFSFFDYKVPLDYLAKFPYNKTIVVFSYFLLHE